MAPTFRPGKGARFAFNNSDFSVITQTVTATMTQAALKTTCFQQNDQTYVAGIGDGTAAFDGVYDASKYPGSSRPLSSTGALDIKISNALAASSEPIVTFGPEGDALGRRTRMWRQETVEYTAQAPISDVLKWSGKGQVSGYFDAGVSLNPVGTPITSTGAQAAVDSGAAGGTVGGGVGHFHMFAQGTISTFQARIQHSSNGSAWADLITFSSCQSTTQAGKSVQRTTVAGTVKQQVRLNIPTFTGAGKTATIWVAFARRSTRGV